LPVTLNPYISFRTNAREAMDFYQGVFGGEVTRSTFGEFGVSEDPAEKDLVMHSMLVTPNGLTLMCADTPAHMEVTDGTNISVSLSGDDDAALRGYWEKLSDGATIGQPLMQAPWGDTFGMLTDRFGIAWMVNILGQQPG
jgi:PhnB protein